MFIKVFLVNTTTVLIICVQQPIAGPGSPNLNSTGNLNQIKTKKQLFADTLWLSLTIAFRHVI